MNKHLIFFGTDDFATIILDELKGKGILPTLIITSPDKPQGRKLILTPPPVKVWAEENNIEYWQPEHLDTDFIQKLTAYMPIIDLGIVASYGKIIPQDIISLPKHKTLNVHPSLLPKLRGASPIQSALLYEDKTGVSIMRIDEKMDHGPLLAQEEYQTSAWPIESGKLERDLAHQGGALLATIIPQWIKDKLQEQEQDHSNATYTKKIIKKDGLLDLSDSPEKNLRKIKAFSEWPRAYFFTQRNGKEIRIIVTDAIIQNGELSFLRVIPEGKKEMSYEEFLKGNR